MLFIIGTACEFLAMYVVPKVIPNSAPPFIVSLIIVLVAQTRWGYKGTISIPILALVSFFAGCLVGTYDYHWTMLIADFVGLGASSIILLLKKSDKNILFNDVSSTIYQCIIILIIEVIVFFLFSCIFGGGILGSFMVSLIEMLPCTVGTLIMMVFLQRQGVLKDVKKDLISKKEEQEMEKKYYSQYQNDVIEKNDKK